MNPITYLMPLEPGSHPGMDAVAHGLAAGLGPWAEDLRVLPTDLREGPPAVAQAEAIERAVDAGSQAIVLFVLDPLAAREAIADARARGVRVVAIHAPVAEVDALVRVPNFHHGVSLAHFLARRLEPGSEVGIVGGPEILDDLELVDGLLSGCRSAGLRVANDPHEARFRNLDDVRDGAVHAVQAVLDHHPRLDGLIVFNDETLLGALPLLEERDLPGRLPIVCRNGGPAAVELVRAGKLQATYDYLLPEIGIAAGRLVARLLAGEMIAPDHTECPGYGRIIHADNASDYRPWSQRAEAVELRRLS